MSAPRHTLDEIQRWMQAAITHPGGPEAALSVDDVVRASTAGPGQLEQMVLPSRALTSLERLDIYYHAYYARLLECLREEYAVLAFALGAELFDQFAVAYLQEHPPHSYTLAQLGACFPEFLQATRPDEGDADADWADFMIDLARLERVVNEVFDGPGTERGLVLTPARLQELSPEDWLDCRLVPAPCLRLLSLRFPVNDYFTAAARKDAASIPAPRETWLAITRRDYRVRRLELSRVQFALLEALLGGAPVGTALARAAEVSTASDEELAGQLHGWFRQWAEGAFFVDVVMS